MVSHSDPKWCCVSSLTKIVTFFAVPFWTIPTPPAVLHQLNFFDRCEDFVPLVGQAIAFCGLSCLGKARQPDRRQKPMSHSHNAAWLLSCCSVGRPILAAAGFQPAGPAGKRVRGLNR